MNKRVIFVISLIIILSVALISAEVPEVINYQGNLTDSEGNPLNGVFSMVFTIWDQVQDGQWLWQEEHLDGQGNGVVVTDGFFNVLLGELTLLPGDIFDGSDRWLSIRVGADPEISPRVRLSSVAYSYHSASADVASGLSLTPTIVSDPCNPDSRGTVYYHEELDELCYCNGLAWVQVDGGGACQCEDLDGDYYDNCDPSNTLDTDGLPADCDDTNDQINPGMSEICSGGLDEDCDGYVDCNDTDCYCMDGDDDGYGDPANVCCPYPEYDCDDGDFNINPEAVEICDGVDNDCDALTTEDACPVFGDIVICEIMPNPATESDIVGEWFEVVNLSGKTLTLRGVVISDGGGGNFQINTDLIVEPGDYVTFANSDSPGFTPDYDYTGLSLNNTGDAIIITVGETVIDGVYYTTDWPYGSGVSMSLNNSYFDPDQNDVIENWCSSTSSYNGDLGTPGMVNDACP